MANSCSKPLSPDLTWDALVESSLAPSMCSIWTWCPCEDNELWSYCSRESLESCPHDDIVTDACGGNGAEGGWSLVCGDGSLGPPCRGGLFYGEIAMVCRCPQTDTDLLSASSESLSGEPEPEGSCGDQDIPEPPAPWDYTPAADYVADDNSPAILFALEECVEGAQGFWTWCPCDSEPEVYPEYSELRLSCPYDEDDCDDAVFGDGYWLFRGGCSQLGPPPVDGRFYGETLAVGYCCGSLSSLESEESSEEIELSFSSYSLSCPMPAPPQYAWLVNPDDQFWQDAAQVNTDAFCQLVPGAGGWLWCQCTGAEGCDQLWGTADDECPYDTPTLIGTPPSNGYWSQQSDAAPLKAPPVQGRFFGEIIWSNKCPQEEVEQLEGDFAVWDRSRIIGDTTCVKVLFGSGTCTTNYSADIYEYHTTQWCLNSSAATNHIKCLTGYNGAGTRPYTRHGDGSFGGSGYVYESAGVWTPGTDDYLVTECWLDFSGVGNGDIYVIEGISGTAHYEWKMTGTLTGVNLQMQMDWNSKRRRLSRFNVSKAVHYWLVQYDESAGELLYNIDGIETTTTSQYPIGFTWASGVSPDNDIRIRKVNSTTGYIDIAYFTWDNTTLRDADWRNTYEGTAATPP